MSDNKISESVICNLCGQDNVSQLYTTMERQLVRCRNCGLVYVKPWISCDLIYQEKNYFNEKNQYASRVQDFQNTFNLILDWVEMYKYKGRLLDIGCGTGTLLSIAQNRGWEVSGVEISQWAARVAVKEVGVPVFCGELESAKFPWATFDVIILNHSLEHMPNPSGVLLRANKLLKEDGILVVGVPNYNSLFSRLKKSQWDSLLPEQHRWHFTPKTLARILFKNGFLVVDTYMENHVPANKSSIRGMLSRLLSWISLRLSMGEAMLIIARRNNKSAYDRINSNPGT